MSDSIHGNVVVEIDSDGMAARIIVNEPQPGGMPITYEKVCEEISKKGIRHNLNLGKVKKIFENKYFGRSVVIAKGERAIDGKNGSVLYHFEQKETQDFVEDEFGNVDYRDLGIVKNIEEGTVVAEIIAETQGTPGTDVKGTTIAQTPGKPPVYKVGQGIKLSEDGLVLYAGISGNLRWNKDHFVVDKDVTVSGDVDASVGNIDFIGDVVIKGNVEEGYEIRSGGNITVFGTVTGATLHAAGKITVKMGVLSSNIEANEIVAGFFENSTIECHGNLTAQNFIACQVTCHGKLIAHGGKAAIIGGKYTCLSDIEANIVGSDTYTRTLIVLGNTAVLTEERNDLLKKIEEYENKIDQLGKICSTLQHQKKVASLTEDREEMLVTSIRAKYVHQRELKNMRGRIIAIDKEIDVSNDLRVVVKRSLFPGVSIRINSLQHNVEHVNGKCVVRVGSSGEIEIK